MSRVLRSVTALAVTLFLAAPASARAAVADPCPNGCEGPVVVSVDENNAKPGRWLLHKSTVRTGPGTAV